MKFHRRRAVPIDVTDLANTVADGIGYLGQQQHHHNIVQQAADTGSGKGSTVLEAVLTTLYAATSDVVLKPAHGHSQPLWGEPDPYLAAGKSIAPSAKALAEMGIQKASVTAAAASSSGEKFSAQVQRVASDGWSILNGANVHQENVMPGFAPTGGILQHHDPRVPAETPETFAAQVEWSAKFLNVIDKLPYAALAYAMVEFFFVRPGLDVYKEDIEEGDPTELLMETVMVTGVRLGAFALVAVATLILFGG